MRTRSSLAPHFSLRPFRFVLSAALILAGLAGFSAFAAGDKTKKDKKDEDERKESKTIGDVVAVSGLQSYAVEGIGLVAGLDGTGSNPVNGPDRSALLQEMQKRGVKDPEDVLRSSTTALVRLRAKIPPAARSCKSTGCWCKDKKSKRSDSNVSALRPHRGDTFDVEVEIPPNDSTTSLKGGWLLEAWLYETATLAGAGKMSGHVLARAEGPVLVTGGLDGSDATPGNLRHGRLLGGAIANDDRDFALITEADRTAKWTILIAARINERFPHKTRDGKSLAEPKDAQRVVLKIPPRYRQNVARYLELLRYMPLTQTGAQESERMTQWGEELLDPKKARKAALRLEGIGSRAVETLKKGVESSDPDVRFFAAEALAYLDEPIAGEPLALAAREVPEYRAHALTALSSLDEAISPKLLGELMDGTDSVELRYGAFRALRVLNPDDPLISGEIVGDQLYLHQVASTGAPFIHITSRERAEIVLFGRDMKLETPLLLNAGNKIMLSASGGAPVIKMSRFDTGQPERHQWCELDMRDVIRKAIDMGASYPDIVGLLVQADQQHNLAGRLAIDTMPDPTRVLARVRRMSDGPGKATENVAMPNLFRWTDPRRSGGKSDSDDGDEEKIASKNAPEPQKPSLWDRLLRRTAN